MGEQSESIRQLSVRAKARDAARIKISILQKECTYYEQQPICYRQ